MPLLESSQQKSSLPFSVDILQTREQFGRAKVFPLPLYPSPNWFKTCNYLLLGEAVNWIKVVSLSWVNYLHLPTWWARPDKRAGGTDLDSAFAFMASSWKEMNFSNRRGRCASGICSRRVSSASALPEMQLPALSAAKWSQLGTEVCLPAQATWLNYFTWHYSTDRGYTQLNFLVWWWKQERGPLVWSLLIV